MIVSAFTEEEIELLRPQPTYPRWVSKQSQIINAANAKCVERNEWRTKCSAIKKIRLQQSGKRNDRGVGWKMRKMFQFARSSQIRAS